MNKVGLKPHTEEIELVFENYNPLARSIERVD